MNTAQEKLDAIRAHLLSGKHKRVVISTYLKATCFAPKHIDMLRVRGNSLYMQRGKNWDCADYCAIRFGEMK